MSGVDVPQGSNMMKQIEMEDFEAAYRVACLGATEPDWRVLALRALRANQLDVAKSAFGRLKDSKFLHLIESIERDQAEGGGGANNTAKPVAPKAPAAAAASGGPGARRGRGAATTQAAPEPSVPASKASLDPSWQAEILAYQGHHHEAAKIYARAGRVDEAIRLFTDLRRWNDAKMFAQSLSAEGHGSFDHSQLVRQQAEWLEEINDWRGAATIFVSMEKYMQAAKLLADSASPDNIGWQVLGVFVLCYSYHLNDSYFLILCCP
jgi:intraflagellar transport protein 122